jgi:hypothetical protein
MITNLYEFEQLALRRGEIRVKIWEYRFLIESKTQSAKTVKAAKIALAAAQTEINKCW